MTEVPDNLKGDSGAKDAKRPQSSDGSDGYEVVGGLSQDSVLRGFDPESDFDQDIAAAEGKTPPPRPPEKPRRKPTAPAAEVADAEDVESIPVDGMPLPLIKPPLRAGIDAPQVLFGAGGVILVIAMLVSGWTAKGQNLAVAVLTGYQTILHTITGVIALVLISLLQGRPVGSYEQGAARLFVAIGLFQLVLGMEFGLLEGKGEEFASAAVVYALTMMILFRMRFKTILEIIAIHMLIVGVMWLGTQLAIAAVPTVKK